MGTGEFLPTTAITQMLGRTFCNVPGVPNHICENIMFILAGYNEKQMNEVSITTSIHFSIIILLK